MVSLKQRPRRRRSVGGGRGGAPKSAHTLRPVPKKTFVMRTYSSRGHASSLSAVPISSSHCPLA